MKTQSTRSAIKTHEFLINLIKTKFNVFLEIHHERFSEPFHPITTGLPIRARTVVMAYRSLEDARRGYSFIAMGTANCAWQDRFERAKGLTIALQRLYRQLANQAH